MSSFQWSGDVRISSLPGNLNPQSLYGPSLAVHRGTLHMVYLGASSSKLYAASYDGKRWQGNTQIKIPGHDAPASSHAPSLAVFNDTLYMVYRGSSSNTLYVAWNAGRGWAGNTPISIPGNDPKSQGGPALAAYGQKLYMVYRGEASDTLHRAWYDGNGWHGNEPISTKGGASLESSHTPAVVPYNDRLYLVYKGGSVDGSSFADSLLYTAYFDGSAWYGNKTISTKNGQPESSGAPWCGVLGGELMIMYTGKKSNSIYWTMGDGSMWFGNVPVSEVSNINPRTTQTGGAAAFLDRLTMVYRGSNDKDLFEAQLDIEN